MNYDKGKLYYSIITLKLELIRVLLVQWCHWSVSIDNKKLRKLTCEIWPAILWQSRKFDRIVLFTTMFGVELELNTFLMNEWISKTERIRKEEYLNMNLSSKEGE